MCTYGNKTLIAKTNCCLILLLFFIPLGVYALETYSGTYYYANGNYYTTKSGYYYGSSGVYSSDQYRHPYLPNPDYGAPDSEWGWVWAGWNGIYKGGSIGTVNGQSYYSTYSRTNYYHYYNSDSATSITTKRWVQTYKDASASYVTLPALVAQSVYNWKPQGWTATDKSYSSASDVLYSSIDAQTVYFAANTNQNIRAVYNRTKTVLFNGNGASSGTVANQSITQWLVAGKGATGTITLPANGFTRTGHTFNGWSTSSTATNGLIQGTSVTPDGTWTSVTSQTYYATWAVNKYTILYEANGGSGTMVDVNATYNADVTINENGFTRLAYVFKGWATESDGDVVYTPGQQVKNLTAVNGDSVILYAIWEPLVVPSVEVSAVDGTEFCGESYAVTLSCPLDGATIYYSTNGVTPRTSAAFAYTEPIVIYGSAGIVAIAVKDGVKSDYTRVSITQIAPDAPVIAPADGTEFRSATCEVTISCTTDGAEIYYTIDGSTPQKGNGTKYVAPFTIAETTIVKAVAVGGPLKSKVVTATISKRSLSLAEAAGMIGLTFETDENVPWHPIVDGSAFSGFAAQSGTIGIDSCMWMETSVRGAGMFSFNWRVACEKDDSDGATWDRLVVFTNAVEAARIDGVTEWQNVSFVFGDEGKHIIRWEFVKDDYDEDGATFADNAWVSGVSWVSNDPIPAIEESTELGWALSLAQDKEKLSDKLTSVEKYQAFRNWVDGKGLGHSTVAASPNAWLSYALDAPGLMAKATPIVNEDVSIEAITPSNDVSDAFDLLVGIADVEIGTATNLAEVFGIEGAMELNGATFSSNGLSVTLQLTADGKAKATVVPDGTPPTFFLRVKVK